MTVWFAPVTIDTAEGGRLNVRTAVQALELLMEVDWAERCLTLEQQDLLVRCVDICLADLAQGTAGPECRTMIVEAFELGGLNPI